MKFKLDENFGRRTVDLFAQFGHEVETVLDEKLSGAADKTLFEVCVRDRRCLVSLDLDFADVLRFPPDRGPGIAVLRLPKGASLGLLTQMIRGFLMALETESIFDRLWIIEVGRIRVHEDSGETDTGE